MCGEPGCGSYRPFGDKTVREMAKENQQRGPSVTLVIYDETHRLSAEDLREHQ